MLSHVWQHNHQKFISGRWLNYKKLLCVCLSSLLLSACASGSFLKFGSSSNSDDTTALTPEESEMSLNETSAGAQEDTCKCAPMLPEKRTLPDGLALQTGLAGIYPSSSHGKMTKSKEPYDKDMLTAGHTTLPLNSYARIHSSATGKEVTVKINDRIPKGKYIVILSEKAAREIGISPQQSTVSLQPMSTDESSSMNPRGNMMSESEDTDKIQGNPSDEEPIYRGSSRKNRSSHGHGSGFYVQYGAFANQSNAIALQNRLNASVGKTFISHQNNLYYVRQGPFSQHLASSILQQKRRYSGLRAVLIRE